MGSDSTASYMPAVLSTYALVGIDAISVGEDVNAKSARIVEPETRRTVRSVKLDTTESGSRLNPGDSHSCAVGRPV